MTLRLVVVDDDISIREMLKNIIAQYQLGLVVGESGDGVEAEGLITALQPDIALVDVLLPGQDGISMINKLRRTGLNTAFIVISQVNNSNMVDSAYSSGVEFFIHKPLNVLEVTAVIKKVAENRDLKEALQNIQRISRTYAAPGDAPPGTHGASDFKTNLYRVFTELGILGEAGTADICRLVEELRTWTPAEKNAGYQLSELYDKVAAELGQDRRTVEQRIRRTIGQALQNIAWLGADDYYQENFQRYSVALFDFKEVRQEIEYIKGKSAYRGKINVKKFLEGIMFLAETV